MKSRYSKGITLIELMIVVVIIGVLAGIAYPSYRNYLVQSRRSDAQTILLRVAALQEKFYADCSTYAGSLAGAAASCGPPTELGMGAANPPSPEGYYILQLTAGAINASVCNAISCGFTITANPVAGRPQDGDGALRIDSTGLRQWNRKGAGTWVSWSAK